MITKTRHTVAQFTRTRLPNRRPTTDWLRYLLSRPLDMQASLIYTQMMTQLQKQLLIMVVSIGSVLSIPFALQSYTQTWINHIYPVSVFVIQILRGISIIGLVALLVQRGMVRAAWITMVSISISTTLILIQILQEPGLIVFLLFSTAGPALSMSWRVSVMLTTIVIAATSLIGRSTFVIHSTNWFATIIIFGGVMLVFTGFGVMIRRFMKQFAETTVEIEREAIRRTQAEHKVNNLSRQMRQIALLEHDLRQPLKAIQGNLMSLTVDVTDADEIVAPALAAAQRAERLVSNLLDHARIEANQYRLVRVRTDLHVFFAHLHAALPGLARYYTEPPIPIHIELDRTPMLLLIDPEHFERAVFNLLDNALAYAPNESVINVRVQQSGNKISIEVQDSGPGIPNQVIAALMERNATSETVVRTGFGLQQVKTLVETYDGTLAFTTSSHGTIVCLKFPYDGAVA